MESARTGVAGFGRSEASRAAWAVKRAFTNQAQNGMISTSSQTDVKQNVNFVCRLNRELYQVVSRQIETDEVIITEQQIMHVNDGHPGMYEKLAPYLADILDAPDYILRANKPNSALVIKRIEIEHTVAEVVLRLKVVEDPAEYKNSIISLWGISEKRCRRLLRQSEILYKRE